mmetsp:Transcript_94187/g.167506  ORF Transcript_94187/g.167506 Transcript_94187/m.167506 type:complete len:206 (-) Transcript_94187:218-835(-)
MHVDGQRLITHHANVEPHVELFPADQERRLHVFLHNIQLWPFSGFLVLRILLCLRWTPVLLWLPLLRLCQLVDEEDAGPLGAPDWLHDPCRTCPFLELLNEHVVLLWHHESDGADVVPGGLLQATLLLTKPLHALHVLHQEVFPSKLVVVEKMVDMLMRIQVNLVEERMDPIFVGPENIPFGVHIRLFPAPGFQDIVDRVVLGVL